MINVPCKRHFAQAKDIEWFLQDQPDFLETGNGGRPALKEAKTTDESNNNMIICVLLRFLISFALSVLMSFRVEASMLRTLAPSGWQGCSGRFQRACGISSFCKPSRR